MLVLSRKKNQRILFPNLGIEVVVQRIVGSAVSVGITAPKSVQILRGELADEALLKDGKSDLLPSNRELLHTLRNQLNKAQLTVALAQKQLQLGKNSDAESTLSEMVSRLTEIDQQIDFAAADVSPNAIGTNRSITAGSTKRALIVEDDENERALLAGYLRLCGFSTSEASDGVEAMSFLARHAVDVVILDMRMPRMNGLETVKAIRSRPHLQNIKIVIVSGEDREELSLQDAPEVAEWFPKPLNPDRLARYFDTKVN